MQTVRKYIKRNPVQCSLAGGAIVLILLNFGTISKSLEQNSRQREALGAANQSITQLQLSEQNRLRIAEIANARYDAGCELIINGNDRRKYTSLIPGEGVLNGNYEPSPDLPPSAYLPAGTVVCDAFGNTAVLKDEAVASRGNQVYPVARDFASTQDRDRIRRAIAGKTQKRPQPINNSGL